MRNIPDRPWPQAGDALLIIDAQVDFLPGGSLAVAGGDKVIAPLNRSIQRFIACGLPIVATRDWHPPDHSSFSPQGGPWPPHCVAGTPGAAFAPGLRLPPGAQIVSKGTAADRDAYSAFTTPRLGWMLHAAGATHIVVGGLATDYCVLQTVLDALELGFGVVVLRDAVAAVDLQPGDGERALARMAAAGARIVDSGAWHAQPEAAAAKA
jgi:nicotinamidase/pyrazinamidase